MRLWHIDLIPYLPKGQLLSQWRELNSIFKKQDNHILIKYIYNYPKDFLYIYTVKVLDEMYERKYNVKSFENYDKYFEDIDAYNGVWTGLRFKEHNNEYLTICYYNLKEKYLRGQKDFPKEVWDKLDNFYKGKIK